MIFITEAGTTGVEYQAGFVDGFVSGMHEGCSSRHTVGSPVLIHDTF